MKKILWLFTVLACLSSVSYSKAKSKLSDKVIGIRFGVKSAFTENTGQNISVGPDVGFGWEKWGMYRSGFITEINAGFSNVVYTVPYMSDTDIESHFKIAVSLIWGYELTDRVTMKTGLRSGILINTGKNSVPVLPCLQIPFCISYDINRSFYLDFDFGLPFYFYSSPHTLPLQLSLGVSVGWRYPK